jgi:hypothetical protein
LRAMNHFTLIMYSTGHWWWRQWGGVIRQRNKLRTYLVWDKCTSLINWSIGDICLTSFNCLHIIHLLVD